MMPLNIDTPLGSRDKTGHNLCAEPSLLLNSSLWHSSSTLLYFIMAETTASVDKDSKRHTRWPSEDGKEKPTALEDEDNKSKLTKFKERFLGRTTR